ncbi:hypothetical protein E1295_17860 [Nonomuraea mesophila]|uniref:DUF1795 domain-containing protein n=1 Tax=Nonomuraea mesophila TaxID=2530382 RepID=A0A4R5FJ27_9ACTN|nr:hypothetical protein [Nonomuraea mesophila]TDE52794.1 hypothetical protein E1295_17860 [Nonomuraea mesophila]
MSRIVSHRLGLALTGAALSAALGLTGGPAAALAAPTDGPAAAATVNDGPPLRTAYLSFDELPDVGVPWVKRTDHSTDDGTPDWRHSRETSATEQTADGWTFAETSRISKHLSMEDAHYYADHAALLEIARETGGIGGSDPMEFEKISTVGGVDVYHIKYYVWGHYTHDAVEFIARNGLYTFRFSLQLPKGHTALPDLAPTIAGVQSNLNELP